MAIIISFKNKMYQYILWKCTWFYFDIENLLENIIVCCDVAVPRASAEFLPNRVRREIARTVPQSPERRFVIVLISSPIGFSFIFFFLYERMSTEAIEAEEQLKAQRKSMENVGESERGVRAENAEPEPGGKIEA